MTFVSHAQNFEDVLLWRALRDVKNGRYIDIGAQDPVVDSVSLAFYEAGWRGIHIEPSPNYASELRKARPDETVIEAAVTDTAGPIEFFEIESTGISTGRSDIADHHLKSGFSPRRILTPTVRLDELLKLIDGDVHWLKVDVEGMEADVLRSWGDCAARPWILVIESTFPNSQLSTRDQWVEEVLRRDYREVFFDGLNCYFVHGAQQVREEAFKASPNVFDGFVVADQHFSAKGIRGRLEEAESRYRDKLDQQAALRHASEASAAAAIENANRVREELTAEAAKKAALLAQLTETQRDHLASVEMSWRERQAAEAELREAVQVARESEKALRIELAKSEERAEGLQRELRHRTAEYDRVLRVSDEERQRFETARAAEANVCIELARIEERAEGLRRDLQRQTTEHERTLRFTDEERERQRQLLDAAQAAETNARAELARVSDKLEAELQERRSAVARADSLIRNACQNPTRAWDRIGAFLGLSGTPRIIETLSEWPATNVGLSEENTSKLGNYADDIGSPGPARMSSKNPYLRASSLHELLNWDDVDFVRCAYVTVLGRQPDPQGEAYYTDRIRRGHSKMEVLWQLRRSEEGPNHDPGIAGFDRALKKAAWERNRAFGWAVRLFTSGEGDGRSSRRHRETLNRLALIALEQMRQSSVLHGVTSRLSQAPSTNPPVVLQEVAIEMPAESDQSSTETGAELDSRTRYALNLLQLEFGQQ